MARILFCGFKLLETLYVVGVYPAVEVPPGVQRLVTDLEPLTDFRNAQTGGLHRFRFTQLADYTDYGLTLRDVKYVALHTDLMIC